MRIIDSHCHLAFPDYEQDRSEVIARAFATDVAMIGIGVNLESSKKELQIAEQYDNIWCAIGAHPTDAGDFEPGTAQSIEFEDLLSSPKVVAVGEVGLDYYRTPEPEKRIRQQEIFKEFLVLSVKHNKPVIIHSRDSGKGSVGIVHGDLLSILRNTLPARGGVAHSFTGTIDEARKYLDLGFYLGFNGIITFARQYDELVKFVPLDRILLETDAPFLAPEPHRGQRNESSYIIEVAKKLAELKGETYDNIIQKTTENSRKLFGL